METIKIFKGANHTRMKDHEHDVMRCARMGENIGRLYKSVLQIMQDQKEERLRLPKRWSKTLGEQIRSKGSIIEKRMG